MSWSEFYLLWVTIGLSGYVLTRYIGLHIAYRIDETLGFSIMALGGIIIIMSVLMILSGLFGDRTPPANYPRKNLDQCRRRGNIENEPRTRDYRKKWANDVISSTTDKLSDYSYRTTILSHTYGAVQGYGMTSEESQIKAKRLYEHWKEDSINNESWWDNWWEQ